MLTAVKTAAHRCAVGLRPVLTTAVRGALAILRPGRGNGPPAEPGRRGPEETVSLARLVPPWIARPGDRELPPMRSSADEKGKTAVEPAVKPPAKALGLSTGSAVGQGSMTLDVTDFPHAWYLRQVLQKVEQRWQTQDRPNEPGQKPRVAVQQRRAPLGTAKKNQISPRKSSARQPFPCSCF